MKIYVFPNLDKANCKSYTIKACEILCSNGAEIYMDQTHRNVFEGVSGIVFGGKDIIPECDYILSVGGDGTILKCSGYASKYKKPMLGLNCGRLGFMATLEHSELHLLNDFCDGKFSLDKRMMIDVEVHFADGTSKTFTALNDIVVSKDSGCKIADFKVSKGEKVISALRADGIIFSTPTGATAYSLSAGGPIIEPSMNCIEFTQICAHSLFARSMIFDENSVIDVGFRANANARAVLTVDGNEVVKLSQNDKLRIFKSESCIELIDIKGGSFFSSVNRKLMQPLKELSEEV